ncbi:MAG: hypothetical protein ACJ8H8_35865, partial [Geminicoccaceae bacterium]
MHQGSISLAARAETQPLQTRLLASSGDGRLTSLDSLRGVAALLVVTFHCWKLELYTPPQGWEAHLWAWTPLNLAISGRPAVILFF